MSRVRQPSQRKIRRIVIALDSKQSVRFKNGSLKCHLNQDTFQFVGVLLWSAILKDVATLVKSNISNAVICQLEGGKH